MEYDFGISVRKRERPRGCLVMCVAAVCRRLDDACMAWLNDAMSI